MSNPLPHFHRRSAGAALAVLTLGALVGCSDAEPAGSIAGAEVEPMRASVPAEAEQQMGLAALRRATAPYHDVSAAVDDGFVQAMPCAENPFGDGGLGIPYLHIGRLVDGALDVEEPEVLFYEPQRNGTLRLVGVEMVVPIAMWTGEDPPELFGHGFHTNEAAGLYGIHIWTWLHNPEGMFADGHPDVSCEFAS